MKNEKILNCHFKKTKKGWENCEPPKDANYSKSKGTLAKMPPMTDIETGKKIKHFNVLCYIEKTVERTEFEDGTIREVVVK